MDAWNTSCFLLGPGLFLGVNEFLLVSRRVLIPRSSISTHFGWKSVLISSCFRINYIPSCCKYPLRSLIIQDQPKNTPRKKEETPETSLPRSFLGGTNDPKKISGKKNIWGYNYNLNPATPQLSPPLQKKLKRFFFKTLLRQRKKTRTKTNHPTHARTWTKLKRLTNKDLIRLLSQNFNLLRLRLPPFHARAN